MIFKLHSFDFPVSTTVSVIQHFPVSVLVTVNLGLFFSYCAISVSVTVHRNKTDSLAFTQVNLAFHPFIFSGLIN